MGFALQALTFLLFPVVAIWASRTIKPLGVVGPIVVCYAFGIVLANLGITPTPEVAGLDGTTSESTAAGLLTGLTVILAIPMLLFSADFRSWLRIARPAVLSFGLSIVAIVGVAVVTTRLFDDLGAESSTIAGMTVGVYTGGTPNMAAIGTALDVPEATFIALNGADLAASALYLLALMTFLPRLLARILPRFPWAPGTGPDEAAGPDETPEHDEFAIVPTMPQVLQVLGVAVGVVALAVGLTIAVFGSFESQAGQASVILLVTTLGIGASFVPRIHGLTGSYEVGQYLFLVFAVAIGSQANLVELADAFGNVLPFIAVTLFVASLLHYLLCAGFGVDRDTAIITSTAAVFGPPFVGPIAGVLGNREVIVSGMTTGVVGLAVGNFAGLAVAAIA